MSPPAVAARTKKKFKVLSKPSKLKIKIYQVHLVAGEEGEGEGEQVEKLKQLFRSVKSGLSEVSLFMHLFEVLYLFVIYKYDSLKWITKKFHLYLRFLYFYYACKHLYNSSCYLYQQLAAVSVSKLHVSLSKVMIDLVKNCGHMCMVHRNFISSEMANMKFSLLGILD